MQGPAIDLVLLALLILFVGIQQYARPQLRNRLWFAGWIFFFLSYVVWEFPVANPVYDKLREAFRFDLLLLAQLTFVTSFVASAQRLRRVVLAGMIVGVPAVLAFNAHEISRVSLMALVPAVVLWQVYGVYGMKTLLPPQWRVRRLLILCVCVGYGSAFVAHLLSGKNPDVQDWVLAELLLCCAALYGADDQRRSLASLVGTVGFLAWAVFYLLDAGVTLTLLHGWRHWLAVFWNVPKFFVAFSMVLQMSEDARIEKEQLAERYRELYDDFRLLYERNPHPMWIYDEATSRFLSANRAAVRAYGYTERELLQMEVMDLLAEPEPGHATAVKSSSEVLGETVRMHHRLKDKRVIAADVTEHRILFQGEPARFVMAVDVTELERESRELQHRAHHDALTGLPNRHELNDRIDACLERSVRDRRKAVLLTIDVDYFKQVNDTHGHLVGDECLKAVAARLQSRIRQVDTLARTGGEEFTAIIGGLSSADDAPKIAATLLGIFAAPMTLAGCEIQLSISIGAAIFPDNGTDRETLRQRSDEALYEAKRQGRNRAIFALKPAAMVNFDPIHAK
jgi:diguanylate cyclase (GGDEF)-like protein/PAS domain S-box-containing protein